jgi:hypothetical protein
MFTITMDKDLVELVRRYKKMLIGIGTAAVIIGIPGGYLIRDTADESRYQVELARFQTDCNKGEIRTHFMAEFARKYNASTTLNTFYLNAVEVDRNTVRGWMTDYRKQKDCQIK